MADVTKITLPNGLTYDLRDSRFEELEAKIQRIFDDFYINGDAMDLMTDESGDYLVDSNGRFLIHAVYRS